MKRKYTFIVGAGASAEFEFPVGDQLVGILSELLKFSSDEFGRYKSGDKVINDAFDLLPPPEPDRSWNKNYLYRIASDIGQNMGLALSIDNYLDAQKDTIGVVPIGKLAISRAILEKEAASKLWFDWKRRSDTRPEFAAFPKNWLTNLFRILTAQKNLEQFKVALGSLNFVTFNYDRVIERFFYEATKSYFSLTEEQVKVELDGILNIVHVYGSLGPLQGNGEVAFGAANDWRAVYRASTSINTFTEGVSEKDDVEVAKGWVAESDTLIFLGFAFLRLNVLALKPDNKLDANQRLFGTTLGMSDDNIEVAKNLVNHHWYKGYRKGFDFRKIKGHQLVSDISGYLAEDDII